MQNTKNKEEITIDFPNNSLVAIIVGNHSINITKLEKLLDVSISLFGNQFNISGETKKIILTKAIITNVYAKLSKEKFNNINLNFMDFETELRMLRGKHKSKFDLILLVFKSIASMVSLYTDFELVTTISLLSKLAVLMAFFMSSKLL